MSQRPVGGQVLDGLTPGSGATLDALLGAVRGEKQIAMIGKRWRLRAGRWPDEQSDECLCFECFVGSAWKTIAVLKPDGTWGS